MALDRIAALESKLGVTAEAKSPTTSSSSSDVDPVADSLTPTPQDRQNKQPINIVGTENPLSIKIGGATFTPGGFVDLTGIFRSRDVAAAWARISRFCLTPTVFHSANFPSSGLRDKVRDFR